MMGLCETQPLAKCEVPGFIYYGNISQFLFENWDKPKWGNPLFVENLTLPLDSQTQYFVLNVQLVWSYDCKIGDFCENPHFTIENFKFWEAGSGS